MAEKWWDSWVVKDWNDIKEGKRLFIQAFLAGLKADKPQWHDLRENPNDLPNNRRNVWIIYINGYGQKETAEASLRYKRWVISGYKTECDVIAWCGTPSFDKE